jgi:4-hydroxy-tetrahydrodipicolinate reductase
MAGTTLGILGAGGRVGRLLIAHAADDPDLVLTRAVERPDSDLLGQDAGRLAGIDDVGVPLRPLGPGAFDGCEVVVDFSAPEAVARALPLLGDQAFVTGTTGLDGDTMDRLLDRCQTAPVLVAANFSTGVTVLLDLVARAAAALPDYDIELVEAHHRHKKDAPSGTALALGRAAAGARGLTLDAVATHGREGATGPRIDGTIGFHALRGGGIVGEHQVWLVGPGERVLLGHSAIDRATFARGALRAARWIVGRPAGRYTLRDVLGLTPS